MSEFYSSFVSGFQGLVKQLMDGQKSVEVLKVGDGFIHYRTEKPLDGQFLLLNNTYEVWRSYSSVDPESIIEEILQDRKLMKKMANFGRDHRDKKFRIIVAKENQYLKVKNEYLKELGWLVEDCTGWVFDPGSPNFEVCLLVRKEGLAIWAVRDLRGGMGVEKGELKADLAAGLCYLAELKDGDVFLDPFVGYGAIVAARMRFPVRGVVECADWDGKKVEVMKEKVRGWKQKVIVRQMDALKMNSMANESVDKIVTDPPWGLFEKMPISVDKFYAGMMKEMVRVLKKGGRMVVLTAQKEMMEKEIAKFAGILVLRERLDILVSGKKAGVFVVEKV